MAIKGRKFWDGALCREVDSIIFFPNKGQNDFIQQARWVCSRCDIKQKCLDYALEDQDTKGIWGGTTEIERLRMLRKRKWSA